MPFSCLGHVTLVFQLIEVHRELPVFLFILPLSFIISITILFGKLQRAFIYDIIILAARNFRKYTY